MSSIEMFYYKMQKQKLYNHLRESFGVREYRNEHLDRKIFEAADRINDYVKNSFHSSDNLNNAVLKMNGTVTNCYYFPMHINDCCNWLNTLNIVVCIDKNVDSELDVYVLNDSYTYNVVHNLNTGANEMKLCSLDIKLSDNDMHNIVYSKKKDIATIVFKIPYRHMINPIEFECIIHHEFSHISDI